MTHCVYCGVQNEDPIGYKRKFCDFCIHDKEVGVPRVQNTVILHPAPGQIEKTTKGEIEEIKRLRILPYEKAGGGWYPGRIGDNNKVQERYLKN